MSLQMERIDINQDKHRGKAKKTAQWEDHEKKKRREAKRKQKKGKKKETEFHMVPVPRTLAELIHLQEEHKESIEAVLARHKTNLDTGLTSAEAAERLRRDGPNVLTPVKKKPEWLVFIEQFTSVFAMLLWIGAFLSFVRHHV